MRLNWANKKGRKLSVLCAMAFFVGMKGPKK
jgi:hypothetical protein